MSLNAPLTKPVAINLDTFINPGIEISDSQINIILTNLKAKHEITGTQQIHLFSSTRVISATPEYIANNYITLHDSSNGFAPEANAVANTIHEVMSPIDPRYHTIRGSLVTQPPATTATAQYAEALTDQTEAASAPSGTILSWLKDNPRTILFIVATILAFAPTTSLISVLIWSGLAIEYAYKHRSEIASFLKNPKEIGTSIYNFFSPKQKATLTVDPTTTQPQMTATEASATATMTASSTANKPTATTENHLSPSGDTTQEQQQQEQQPQ